MEWSLIKASLILANSSSFPIRACNSTRLSTFDTEVISNSVANVSQDNASAALFSRSGLYWISKS